MKRNSFNSGFSLVELTLAVGIAAFCLIVLFALLPEGITTNQISINQTIATGLMSGVVDDLRSTPLASATTTSGVSERYGIQIPNANGSATSSPGYTFFLKTDGTLSGELNQSATAAQSPAYRVTLHFYPPASVSTLSSSSTAATRVNLLITWPALADPSAAKEPVNYVGSVETVTSLNRNWANH